MNVMDFTRVLYRTAAEQEQWKRAAAVSVTLPISPDECHSRLCSGDTEDEIRADVQACINLGMSPSTVPIWAYERRREKRRENGGT